MAALRLEPLSEKNFDAAVGLRLKPGQEKFVASVEYSLAQAYVTPSAWPRLVYDGDTPVGFVMANFDPDHEIPEFRCGIWRLLVDADAQGRGAGRYAVDAVASEARRRGRSRITVLWEVDEGGPEEFYLKQGFVRTGELFGQVVGTKEI